MMHRTFSRLSFDRYEVNVLVTQAEGKSNVPIVEELHPTLGNLIGRIEYLSQARRAGHQFPPDQGRRDASRQWRLSCCSTSAIS